MTRRLLWLGCGIFLFLFASYLRTLNPAFRADDSPETIASCATLGIQHPPGYPLHTLVGRVASLFGPGTPAFRLNLMAAFFGALAAALAAATAALWTGSLACGAAAALLLGLSPTFWSQSLAAKGGIYTFHLSLLALLAFCLTQWGLDMRPRLERAQSSRLRLLQSRWFLLSALAFFLGFSNHWETQALFFPAAAGWAFFFMRQAKVDPSLPSSNLSSPLFKAGLLMLAAFSVYLYLPLRAAQHPAMNWGVPDTWRQFWWVLLRQEYLDLEVGFLKALKAALISGGPWSAVAESWPTVQRQGIRVIRHLALPGDLGLLGSALSVLGAWRLFKDKAWERLALGLGLIACFCFVVTFYFHLKEEMIWILDVFLIPAYFMQALLAAYGLAWCLDEARLPAVARALAVAALGLALLWTRAGAVSQHDHFWAWDYGENFLLSLKRDAVVFAEGDFNTMPAYYLQQVKGERRDAAHVTTIFASTDWGVEELKRAHPELGVSVIPRPSANQRVGDGALLQSVLSEIIAKNFPRRPIQASLFRSVQAANLADAEAFMTPSGLTAEYKAPETAAQWQRRMNLPKAMALRYLPDERSRYDPSPEFALSNYGTMYMDLANYARTHGRAAEAMPLFARAVSVTTAPNKAEAYTHWGIALAEGGKLDEAVEKFRLALTVKPLYEAYANLAGVMNRMKRYAEAEPFARQAITLLPSGGQSWNNLAISLYYRGRQAEALEALKTAARLNPQDATIAANLAALGGGK